MCFVGGGDAESEAAFVVGLGGGGQIRSASGIFWCGARAKVPESLADDGVVADFLLVLIAEYEDGGGRSRSPFDSSAGAERASEFLGYES